MLTKITIMLIFLDILDNYNCKCLRQGKDDACVRLYAVKAWGHGGVTHVMTSLPLCAHHQIHILDAITANTHNIFNNKLFMNILLVLRHQAPCQKLHRKNSVYPVSFSVAIAMFVYLFGYHLLALSLSSLTLSFWLQWDYNWRLSGLLELW